MEQQRLKAVGTYSNIENSIFFYDGSMHVFRGELLMHLTPEKRHSELQKWARFKKFVSIDEEILVPGFPRETEEKKNA